jgi:hypothetical protein
MKERLSLGLVAMVCVALLAGSAMGGSVFFSQVTGVGHGAAPETSVIVRPNTTLTLGIWSTDDQDYDTTIGMNVLSADSAAVALIGGEVLNPEIVSQLAGTRIDDRWQDASIGDTTAGMISNMNAARVTSGMGVIDANSGDVAPFLNLDELYDVDAGAFLLGTVTVTTSGTAGDNSDLTINQVGTALFVNAGAQVFPDFTPVNVSVTGIPEPSTLVLVAFGLIAMLGYGLKR